MLTPFFSRMPKDKIFHWASKEIFVEELEPRFIESQESETESQNILCFHALLSSSLFQLSTEKIFMSTSHVQRHPFWRRLIRRRWPVRQWEALIYTSCSVSHQVTGVNVLTDLSIALCLVLRLVSLKKIKCLFGRSQKNFLHFILQEESNVSPCSIT